MLISLSTIALVVTVLICAWTDWTEWRIPNAVVAGSAVSALMIATFSVDGAGLNQCLIGGAAGLIIFMPFYLLKGMAAGDVKMMAAVGMHVGVHLVMEVALVSALIGGIWALVLMDLRKGAGLVSWFMVQCRATAALWNESRRADPGDREIRKKNDSKIPYGVVIAAGTLTTLVLNR